VFNCEKIFVQGSDPESMLQTDRQTDRKRDRQTQHENYLNS